MQLDQVLYAIRLVPNAIKIANSHIKLGYARKWRLQKNNVLNYIKDTWKPICEWVTTKDLVILSRLLKFIPWGVPEVSAHRRFSGAEGCLLLELLCHFLSKTCLCFVLMHFVCICEGERETHTHREEGMRGVEGNVVHSIKAKKSMVVWKNERVQNCS